MTEPTLTLIGTLASAVIAASAGWILLRATKDRIDSETEDRHDRITRALRSDLDLAYDVLDDCRDRNIAWAQIVRRHWSTYHPDERIPSPENPIE